MADAVDVGRRRLAAAGNGVLQIQQLLLQQLHLKQHPCPDETDLRFLLLLRLDVEV
jgi:hypothetical protein